MSELCQAHHAHPHEPAGPESGSPAPARRSGASAVRFLGWFLGFSGLYAMGAVCPFCGRPGCPTGAASAGLVGLVFASLQQWGRNLRALAGRFSR